MEKKDVPVDTGDIILSVLSLPAKTRPSEITKEHHDPPDQYTPYGTGPQPNKAMNDKELSDHSREEQESAGEKQSDEQWIPESCSRGEDLSLKEPDQRTSPTSGFCRLQSDRQHTCSMCHFSHNQVERLLHHIRTEHLVKDSEELNEEALSQQLRTQSSIAKKRSRTSRLCGEVFSDLNTLNRHAKTHTLPYQCDQCGKMYAHKDSLTKHLRIHTGDRPYKCPHCDRGFTGLATLKGHIRTHTGERPFKCNICGKTSIQHLARHMRMHRGERNYLCQVCGKKFLTSAELRLHTRFHTGERPYKCVQCGWGFAAKGRLTSHMRRHTGERPHHCPQ